MILSAVAGVVLIGVLTHVAGRVDSVSRARALTARRALLPGALRGRLETALRAADVRTSADDAFRLWMAFGAAGVVVTSAVGVSLVPFALITWITAPLVGLRLLRRRRAVRVVAALPAALELLATEMRAGNTLQQGVATVASGADPLASDMTGIQARVGFGASFADALARWVGERPHPSVKAAAGALAVASTAGGASASALEGLAASLRDRASVAAEARSQSSQARLSAVVIGLAPIGYLAFSAAVDRRSLDVLLGTAIGRVCFALGIGLEILAAGWMRRMLREEP